MGRLRWNLVGLFLYGLLACLTTRSLCLAGNYKVLNGNCKEKELCSSGTCSITTGTDGSGGTICYAYSCAGGTAGSYTICVQSSSNTDGCQETLSPTKEDVSACTKCQYWQCKADNGQCTSALINTTNSDCRCPATGGTATTEILRPAVCKAA